MFWLTKKFHLGNKVCLALVLLCLLLKHNKWKSTLPDAGIQWWQSCCEITASCNGVVPTVTSETHIINDWTKEWSVYAVATACSSWVVSVKSPQSWAFMNSLLWFFGFFCPACCFCIHLVRLPSWSNTTCVWWYLRIPLLISKLCFVNVKQVQVRLIKVSLRQLSLCCQLNVVLFFFT